MQSSARTVYIAGWLCIAMLSCAHAQFLKPCDLMKMLSSEDEAEGRKGIEGFVQMGPMAAVPLVCFISGTAPGCPNPPDLARSRGEQALVKIGSAAMPALLERLGAKDEQFRTRLVRVLGQIKDVRREQALRALWKTEKSDRVRGALAGALMALGKPDKGLPILRRRIPVARLRELQGLLGQFAMYGADEDMQATLSRVPQTKHATVIAGVVSDLKRIASKQALTAVKRLKAFTKGE